MSEENNENQNPNPEADNAQPEEEGFDFRNTPLKKKSYEELQADYDKWFKKQDKKTRDVLTRCYAIPGSKRRGELTKEAQQKYGKVKSSLMFNAPFFGYLLCFLTPEFIWPEQWPGYANGMPTPSTIACNGKSLLMNPMFLLNTPIGQLCSIVMDQVLKPALIHNQRAGNKVPLIWAMASNYVTVKIVAEMIRSSNKDCKNWELTDYQKQFLNTTYDNMSCEQIYSDLYNKVKDALGLPPMPQPPIHGNGGQGQSQNQKKNKPIFGGHQDDDLNKISPEDLFKKIAEYLAQQKSQQNDSPVEGSMGPDQAVEQILKMMAMMMPMPAGTDPTKAEGDWLKRLIQGYHVAKQQGHGNVPAGIQQLVDKLMRPRIDWKAFLRQFVHDVAKTEYNWNVFNKNYIQAGFWVPALYNEGLGECVVIIDTSGSCSQAIPQFVSEAAAIFNEHRENCLVHLVACDTEAVHEADWEPAGDEPSNIKVTGGGGTSFILPFKLIQEKGWKPKLVLYLTDLDGCLPDRDLDPGCPTLWVCINDRHTQEELPFGQLCIMQDMIQGADDLPF